MIAYERIVAPIFFNESLTQCPVSAKQLKFNEISIRTAVSLNMLWHSRLPVVIESNIYRNKRYVCYGASFDGVYYASAIWSSPVAANRIKDGDKIIELRRMAISEDAPKFTASRMLSYMRKDIKKRMPEIAKLISYQDTAVHKGTIYKASGWTAAHYTKGTSWSTTRRKRNKDQTTADEIRWECNL